MGAKTWANPHLKTLSGDSMDNACHVSPQPPTAPMHFHIWTECQPRARSPQRPRGRHPWNNPGNGRLQVSWGWVSPKSSQTRPRRSNQIHIWLGFRRWNWWTGLKLWRKTKRTSTSIWGHEGVVERKDQLRRVHLWSHSIQPIRDCILITRRSSQVTWLRVEMRA